MATIAHKLMVQATNLNPGQTHHWIWNNATADRVWSFSVDPLPVTLVKPQASYRVEVTRVEYRRNHNLNIFEREVHVWVKNTGTIHTNYRLNMAFVKN